MEGRTPLQVFRNVPVVPVTSVHQHVALGGPIWPDFAMQTAVRHCRGGLPVDAEPMGLPTTDELDQPAVWGGFLDKSFGHFVAEHTPRLPCALRERPDWIGGMGGVAVTQLGNCAAKASDFAQAFERRGQCLAARSSPSKIRTSRTESISSLSGHRLSGSEIR